MTDPVVDRKLLCTEYFRADERVARHAVSPSLSRCQPWRPEVARASDHLRAEPSFTARDPCSHLDLGTSDELMVLENGPSERLGTIEVSIWRGFFRPREKGPTASKTVSTRRCSRSEPDLPGGANMVQRQHVCGRSFLTSSGIVGQSLTDTCTVRVQADRAVTSHLPRSQGRRALISRISTSSTRSRTTISTRGAASSCT
jgi:hypothetical protein